MEITPLLVVKQSNGHYLATLVDLYGKSYEDKNIGSTPREAAEYVVGVFNEYGKSLDVAIPEHLSMQLPQKCATSGQLLKYYAGMTCRTSRAGDNTR